MTNFNNDNNNNREERRKWTREKKIIDNKFLLQKYRNLHYCMTLIYVSMKDEQHM